MANLFWGVSDALDLYDEYINAKKQKVSRPEKLPQKVSAQQKDLVESKEINNRINLCQNVEDLKGSKEADRDPRVEENDPLTLKTEFNDKEPEDQIAVRGIQCDAEYSEEHITPLGTHETSTDNVECHNMSNNGAVSDKFETASEEDSEGNEKLMKNSSGLKSSHKEEKIKVKKIFEDIEFKNEEEKFTDENEEEARVDFPKYTSYFTDMIKKSVQTLEEPSEDCSNVDLINELCELNKDKNPKSFESEEPNQISTDEICEDLPVKDGIDSIIENSETDNATKKHPGFGDGDQYKNIKNSGAGDGPNNDTTTLKNTSTVEDISDLKITNDPTGITERQIGGDDLNHLTEEKRETIIDPILLGTSEDACLSSSEEFEENTPRELNILIFGGGDPRHIIKTMAKRYTHCQNEGTASSVPVLKFYLVDGCMEVVARNILLLGIVLERPELISLRNKVHLFMDVYGNSLLRPICHQYLVSKATMLLKMVSDRETLKKIAPFIHIDSLKYREIDALQDAFEFWHPKPGYDFNIKDYWMSRLRRLLAVRYDARDGVFDWDLNMSLKDRGGQQICSQEYRYWRETGIAFTFPEYEQSKPNKTLAAGLVRNGGRYLHRGYIGDIQTGPFCTFGLKSLEERMHRSAHGENDYRATDVTERNLLEYFHEIQSGTPYVHNDGLSHKYGGVRFQMGERLVHNECDMKDICVYDQPWINVEGIEVHFLPLHDVKEIGKGAPKWINFFDIAFVGYKYFEFLTDFFSKTLRENSLLIMETKLRSVEVKSRIAEFETELQGFARDAKLLSVLNYNALNSKNSILKFWKPDKILQERYKNTD